MNSLETDHGIVLLRASRLEALLAPLEVMLAQTKPENPLVSQTVIAAHPGMKQWLVGALARQRGVGRIIGNLNVQLPSAWLDALSAALLGERAVALPRYRRGHLRWTLHAMLAQPQRYRVQDARVLAYLESANGADERALRQFQLADRLARVFSQYLVYRTDWLTAWEAGQHSWATAQRHDVALQTLETQCLAPLWQAVAAELGDHRGRLVEALAATLQTTAAPLPPLHVVGVSHLPPAEMAVVKAYAQRAPVLMYLPDPCREYWGGLHKASGGLANLSTWRSFREEEQARLDDPEALDWREQGHPLLARWGRMGQHFFATLVDTELREDIRHWQDEASPTANNRLERLQESIRQLKPELLKEEVTAPAAAADASMRIHACHTRQRELEVLRDALLDAMDHAQLRAGDIVVMAPNIQAYVPLIPAVFGEPGSARERLLPYHLADVPVRRSHPLFAVFETLLNLGTSRITAPEVVDLLSVAEVRAALGLDAGDAETLSEWLRNSRVAWALDAAHKQALSLPARADYSFAWAMDRMVAGYLMADAPGDTDPQAYALPDGTQLLPLTGIEGPTAAALGSLDRLLCELQLWRELAATEQSASQWAEMLRARVDALVRIDRTDADARAALSVIHRAIANLAEEPARNHQDPLLRLSVVRDLLQDALASAPERQRFLMGGITFCGMVPQRAIPFAMVCVLGLDEGEFPRRASDGGIDLMARIRRVGDRDVASDDRYLFLETVMSARKRLHLSYIGQGVRDGKHRNPAAPLAELVAELETQCGIAPDDSETPRPWQVWHPLQPFDQRYFNNTSPALFSYSHEFSAMHGDGRGRLASLRDGDSPSENALPNPLPLAVLEGFFKDPAKALLKDYLQLALDALDDDARLPEDEPLDGVSRLHTVARRVFLQYVLPQKCRDPAWVWDRQPPAWVRHGGVLPVGDVGQEAWEKEANAVDALWSQADASARFDARGQQGGQAVRVDVSLAQPGGKGVENAIPLRITGVLRNVFPLRDSEEGVQLVFAFPNASNAKHALKEPAELSFKERIPLFLHWALLRLHRSDGDAPAPVRLTVLAAEPVEMATQINAWDEAFCSADARTREARMTDIRRRLCALIDMVHSGRAGASWFYPKAAWTALTNKPKTGNDLDAWEAKAAGAVANAWVKAYGDGVGERDYAPGYTRLLEGDLMFGDPETDLENRALRALLQEAAAIEALIALDPTSTAHASANAEAV